tara:strand:- start:368 stop:577 length:210 start_codon:yes stop_codon:yes gene_type:complete
MTYSFDGPNGFIHVLCESYSNELSKLESKESYLISCLQSNVSDSYKDGLRWELDVVQTKKRSILEKMEE